MKKAKKKQLPIDVFYNDIKELHSSIIAYYSLIQTQKLDETVAQELERAILASRNIMNAAKKF